MNLKDMIPACEAGWEASMAAKSSAEARVWAHLIRTWNSYHFEKKHKTIYSGCPDPVCVEERALILLCPKEQRCPCIKNARQSRR